MSSDMDEIVQEFLVESYEALDRLDGDLLTLERDPNSPDVLASIFRVMHTIKGTCGFLGFQKLERVAHAAESLLGALRDGTLPVNPAIASALLATGDALRQMLGNIERTGNDGDEDFLHLVATLERLRASGGTDAPTHVPATPVAPRKGVAKAKPAATPDAASAAPDVGDDREVEKPSAPVRPAPPGTDGADKASVAETNIRVDVHVLDNLMTLVGELVLARNHITQLTAHATHDTPLLAAAQHLNSITSDLQDGVMRTRLQPINTAWARFPRVVRDLAMALGKQVRVRTEGDDTELDRSIIEAIKDPLMHLVRNAVDHGIEDPAEREAAGKPAEGTIVIRASHEGGQVTIEMQDDGRGIDVEKVRARGIERGLVDAETAKTLSARDTIELIFQPGFSTADKVTNLSGRGVGMDVVKTNVGRIGGNVEVATEEGVGTTYTLKIPLTLAIVPALLVHSGGERYAIPQINLVELVRATPDRIEDVHGAPVYRLRDTLLPLVSLATELGGEPAEVGSCPIVVLQADDRRFGLIVDAVSDSAEIVVKPLGAYLKGVDTFAGATILGDGRVGLILDVLGLARRAHVLTDELDRRPTAERRAAEETAAKKVALLVFADHEGGRMAIPLELVTRLEEFPRAELETSGPLPVVQYGEEILHLVDISRLMLERRHTKRVDGLGTSGDNLPVLVYEHEGRRVGVVCGQIVDVIRHDLVELEPGSRPGVAGTMVVDGRVTEVLDLPQILSDWDEDTLAALTLEELSA
jgi:two-component system, chemotaxis family, sensor kinase CheA